MWTRRRVLARGALGLAGWSSFSVVSAVSNAAETFRVRHSDAEWRKLLSPSQYAVLRQGMTEPPFSSPLLHEGRPGFFACAGCTGKVFSSEAKFDSGDGWPSFWAPLRDEVIGTSRDTSLGIARTEVHCAGCGGHLGHVFNDGPPVTGLRYCVNGVAMIFKSTVSP